MVTALFITSFILVVIAGIAKAVQDTINFHYYTSVFWNLNGSFWNPQFSSENKYYTRFKICNNKICKLLKRTVFVWTTDAWHLFGMIRSICFTAGLIIGSFTCSGLIYRHGIPLSFSALLGLALGIGSLVLLNMTFELFWIKIFKRK